MSDQWYGQWQVVYTYLISRISYHVSRIALITVEVAIARSTFAKPCSAATAASIAAARSTSLSATSCSACFSSCCSLPTSASRSAMRSPKALLLSASEWVLLSSAALARPSHSATLHRSWWTTRSCSLRAATCWCSRVCRR